VTRKYFFHLPADRSRAAYQEWIRAIAEALGIAEDPAVDTPEKWTKEWISLWEAVDAAQAKGTGCEHILDSKDDGNIS